MNFQKKVKKLRANFEKKAQALANKVRKETIIPLCKEHNISFHVSSDHFFFDKDGEIVSLLFDRKLAYKFQLEELLLLLDLNIHNGKQLGSYIGDYMPPKKRKHYKKMRRRAGVE